MNTFQHSEILYKRQTVNKALIALHIVKRLGLFIHLLLKKLDELVTHQFTDGDHFESLTVQVIQNKC